MKRKRPIRNRRYPSRHKKRRLLWLGFLFLWSVLLLRNCFQEPHQIPSTTEQILLYRSQSGAIEVLPFEDYIIGVVAAEMPAAFAPEALKAQAVCVRTYTCHRLLSGYSYQNGANVSDNPGECQAYVSYAEFAAAHPQDTDVYYDKIRQAVQDTAGEILVCEGQLVEALYHSTCGGHTENAEDIWGKAIPGLKGVSCSWCQASAYTEKSWFFSMADISRILGVDARKAIRNVQKTPAGRLQSLSIGEKEIKGETLRSRLELPSTWIEGERCADGWKLITHGFGHGLGLCQYGAAGMAEAGYDYREILAHYYTGSKLKRLRR